MPARHRRSRWDWIASQSRTGMEFEEFFPTDPNFTDTDTYPGESLPKVQPGECIGILTQGPVTMNGSTWGIAGAVFANGQFSAPQTGAKCRGSIIAQGIDFGQPNSWLVTQPGLKAALPQGMPPLESLRAEGDWIRQ